VLLHSLILTLSNSTSLCYNLVISLTLANTEQTNGVSILQPRLLLKKDINEINMYLKHKQCFTY